MEEPYGICVKTNYIRVTLQGSIDETQAAEVTSAVKAQIERSPAQRCVVFDLGAVRQSTILGRAKLVELQDWLSRRIGRTAWVANTPRFRGLALMICRASDDRNAKAVATHEEAERWLNSNFDRVEDIAKVVETRLDAIRARRKQERKGLR